LADPTRPHAHGELPPQAHPARDCWGLLVNVGSEKETEGAELGIDEYPVD
jgi:hypothetical protein